jgi:hypothetical protein
MLWHTIDDILRVHLICLMAIAPLLFIAVSFLPSVDWVGHIMGLVGGIALACVIFAGRTQDRFWSSRGCIASLRNFPHREVPGLSCGTSKGMSDDPSQESDSGVVCVIGDRAALAYSDAEEGKESMVKC